ncbi:MAG: protein translocase subunit SecF [candidate division WOR-3 bacterium]|nr:protein translocase subunit SecF [candidate division WOR-3 bacterium]MCX7757384.1 protein translocase subunit SecF [candidate division WOR-3 bacterium]MDW7988257.1 protein translocase subunit SecF [candidate division WOR-3 bacterium]
MLQIFKTPNYNFTGRRYIFFILSASLVLITIVAFIVGKGFKYSVDFTGGTLLEIRFSKPVRISTVRAIFRNLQSGALSIQEFGEGTDFIIRFESPQEFVSQESLGSKVIDLLNRELPENSAEIVRIEMVGPRIGKELQRNALIAVLIGLLGILVYVTIRFDFRFGTAAVIALVHDVLVTIGFIIITQTEVSIPIIAALLTIVGYSVNNSIVISDRVRENLRKIHRISFETIVNQSINDTLSRTILTAGTTFVVAIILYLLGAATIKDFAKVISFGVVVGTYSSIYLCGPLVVEWERYFPKRVR